MLTLLILNEFDCHPKFHFSVDLKRCHQMSSVVFNHNEGGTMQPTMDYIAKSYIIYEFGDL